MLSIAISIHTFLAEGDKYISLQKYRMVNFNPHLPRGRWHNDIARPLHEQAFQSTPSSRKVTDMKNNSIKYSISISIHTFLAEGDTFLRRICKS